MKAPLRKFDGLVSFVAACLIAIFVVKSYFDFRHHQPAKLIDWDITLYYHYLPASFIYYDFLLEEAPQYYKEHQFHTVKLEGGREVVKMSSGWALCNLPAFLLADVWAKYTHYARDGLSEPYTFMLQANLLLFSILGVFLLRAFLRFQFSDLAVAATLLLTFLGTNLLYYGTMEPMAHGYGFTLLAAVLWLTQSYILRQSLLKAFFLAFFAGLLILLRPTNAFALLFPLAFFVHAGRKNKLSFNPLHFATVVFAALLPWIPQLLYWKFMTGQWFMYSYGNEGFDFSNPALMEGFFGFRKGWIPYSPVVFFGLFGLAFASAKKSLPGIAGLFSIFLGGYVIFSWWCWWYGGSFGSRAMLEFLPLIAFGLAHLLKWLFRQKWYAFTPALILAACMLHLSWRFHLYYVHGIIHHDSMTKEAYFHMLFEKEFDQAYYDMMERPDYEAALRHED